MTRYQGTVLNLKYDMEFKTDEEFVEWAAATLKKMSPLFIKILDRLLNDTPSIQELKEITE